MILLQVGQDLDFWHFLSQTYRLANHPKFSGTVLIMIITSCVPLAELAQMVTCLPLVQQVRGSIPSGVVNFNLKIFNLGARRGGDVHFLIARLYITVLD